MPTTLQQLHAILQNVASECGTAEAKTFVCSYLGCSPHALALWLNGAASIPPAERKLIKLWKCLSKPLRVKISEY